MSSRVIALPTSSVLSERDVEMLSTGRKFEREDLLKLLLESASKNMKRSPDYALAVGFIVEMIKSLPDA